MTKQGRLPVVSWIREFIADILATRFAGPCFALALQEISYIAKVLDKNSATHPATKTRLAVMLEHLESLKYLEKTTEASPFVLLTLKQWSQELSRVLPKGAGTDFDEVRQLLLSEKTRQLIHTTVRDYSAESDLKSFDCTTFMDAVPDIADRLRRGMPPKTNTIVHSPMPLLYNAVWEVVLSGNKMFADFDAIAPASYANAHRTLSNLAFKAIESSQIVRSWPRTSKGPLPQTGRRKTSQAGLVTQSEVIRALSDRDDFSVDPILEPDQIKDGSINLRLGSCFLVTRATDLACYEPETHKPADIRRFQEHVTKSFGEVFVLHPHRVVLGATLEYIALPDDYAALVLSRSSYGRIGLIVATATYVHPGWKGCLTLELTNVADIPINLRCGAAIAQLVVFRADAVPRREGVAFPNTRRQMPTYPEYAALNAEADWSKLKEFERIVKTI